MTGKTSKTRKIRKLAEIDKSLQMKNKQLDRARGQWADVVNPVGHCLWTKVTP